MSDRRLHFAVVLGCAVLFLAGAGAYGLWDPWESHYAEVARQMRVRGDFVSLFWPCTPYDRPSGDFWSKPVLLFWIEALSFALFGVASPGAPAGSIALSPLTEWACRVPIALFGVLGVWSTFAVTLRFAGRRAAIFAAIACATMPSDLLISRQAMTDMPLVGSMTAATALLALAILEDDAPLSRFARRAFVALFALIAVPSLGVTIVQAPFAVLPFAACFALALFRLARLESRAALFVAAAGLFAGLAVLAKGVVGAALPAVVLLAYLVLARDLRALLRLDLLTGALCFAAVACPWYAAMLALHGRPFYDEMFGDNQWKRFATGRHGDRSGDFTYYLRELGFGLFPWTGIAPLAFLARLSSPLEDRRDRFLCFAAVWAFAAYLVVTLSATKFHHYILPAVPPLAILAGAYLDEGPRPRALLALPVLGLVAFDLLSSPDAAARFLWLFDYDYVMSPKGLPWPEALDYRVAIGAVTALAGIAVLVLARRRKLGAWLLSAAAIGFAVFLADVLLVETGRHWTEKALLSSYYRARAPNERLVAYRMFWRGESFYSENVLHDPALPEEERTFYVREPDDEKLLAFLARHTGERVFVITPRMNKAKLERVLALSTPRFHFQTVDDTHNKIVLGALSASLEEAH